MRKKSFIISFFSLFLITITGNVTAATVSPLETSAKQAILIEATTGDVLYSKEADTKMPTSSMSKVMTMYLVFEALRDGKLKMEQELPVSVYAWDQQGSRMFLNVNQKAKVVDLIRGVIVQSGNDASVVLAEALGGSEKNFAEMMNAKAKKLGMKNSHFTNASGLPDPNHYSTPRDLATLAIATIRDFPKYYHYYSETEFTYNNIKQGNRNPLLYRSNTGVDGLKTGHAEEAGFGLIASAVRDGRRLVMVVNGLPDMQSRADESAKILDWGYREFGLYHLLKKDEKLAEAEVWLGKTKAVSLFPEKDLVLSMPRAARGGLKVNLSYNQPIEAPIAKGQTIGKVIVSAPGKETLEVPLIAGEDVARLGFLDRVTARIKLLMGKK